MNIKLSPSILSADFANLLPSLRLMESVGVDMIHCDVMDGMFVPNLTFGYKMIADINKHTDLVLDVHLMINEPKRYVEQFAEAGSDYITIHLEATDDVLGTLIKIRSLGVKSGLSIKPNTPVEVIKPYIEHIDLLLIMSVEPGFGGQSFMQESIERIKQAKSIILPTTLLQVDGGITANNVRQVINAGANVIVAGSSFFNATDKLAISKILKGE